MKGKRFLNRKGTAIIFAMIIMIIVSIVTTTAILFVSSQNKAAAWTKLKANAHYLALAGLRYGQWYEDQPAQSLPTSEADAETMPDIDGDESNIVVKVWKFTDLTDGKTYIRSKAEFFM